MRCAGQPDLVLQATKFAIRIRGQMRQIGWNETERSRRLQQRDVARVRHERAVLTRVRQHQVLDDEFDIDHAALVVLEVEKGRRVRMARVHPAPHIDDVDSELRDVARQAEEGIALLVERRADGRVAGDEARARQRLVLPRPGGLALIFAKCGETRDQKPRRAIRPQPQIGFVELPRGRDAGQPRVEPLGEARVAQERSVAVG